MSEKLEEKKNERKSKKSGSTSGSTSGTTERKRKYNVNTDGTVDLKSDGDQSGEPSGPTEGTSAGNQDDRENRKRNKLESIRNKRAQGHSDNNGTAPITNQGNSEGDQREGRGNSPGNEDLNGINGGPNREDGRADKPVNSSDGNINDNSESIETDSGRIKKKGVKVTTPPLPPFTKGGLDKPQGAKIKLEDVMTKKEAGEQKERLDNALLVFFKNADKFIGFTTKGKTANDIFIWQSIQKDEIEVISTAMLENAQRSKVIATVTRNITRNYQKLQMGIILIPRFIMTVQNYIQNGIGLTIGGAKHE
jgi:hypothetical protein